MFTIFATLILLLMASPVTAGQIDIDFAGGAETASLTSTANQDAWLDKLVTRLNLTKDTDGDTILCAVDGDEDCYDRATYLAAILTSAVKSHVKNEKRKEAVDSCENWSSLSGADQTTVENLLGGRPCE